MYDIVLTKEVEANIANALQAAFDAVSDRLKQEGVDVDDEQMIQLIAKNSFPLEQSILEFIENLGDIKQVLTQEDYIFLLTYPRSASDIISIYKNLHLTKLYIPLKIKKLMDSIHHISELDTVIERLAFKHISLRKVPEDYVNFTQEDFDFLISNIDSLDIIREKLKRYTDDTQILTQDAWNSIKESISKGREKPIHTQTEAKSEMASIKVDLSIPEFIKNKRDLKEVLTEQDYLFLSNNPRDADCIQYIYESLEAANLNSPSNLRKLFDSIQHISKIQHIWKLDNVIEILAFKHLSVSELSEEYINFTQEDFDFLISNIESISIIKEKLKPYSRNKVLTRDVFNSLKESISKEKPIQPQMEVKLEMAWTHDVKDPLKERAKALINKETAQLMPFNAQETNGPCKLLPLFSMFEPIDDDETPKVVMHTRPYC